MNSAKHSRRPRAMTASHVLQPRMHTTTASFDRRPRFSFVRTLLPALLGLLLSAPGVHAISFVKNVGTAAIGTSNGGSVSVTLGAGISVVAGNTVLVSFAVDPKNGAVSCADSKANAYTVDVDLTNGSGINGVRTAICRSMLTTALVPGDTITVSHPNTQDRAMSVNEFTGGVLVVDQTATGTGTSASPSTATANTTLANELLLGAIAVEASGQVFTAGAGYTALPSSESSNGPATRRVSTFPEYKAAPAAGPYVADGTLSSGTPRWAAALVTYSSSCGNSVVNAGEQCDDGNTVNGDCCDVNCQFEAAGTSCRSAAGVCDTAETCTGSSGTCPANAFAASSTVCRSAAGVCDVAENCTGSSATCPADALVSSGTLCRSAAGVCDIAE